ncbi:MOSC domain-containing protein [Ruegeria sp. 2205SS24-7]|uniref:MOSC domain-containing protein n=1 Tax=Ruegeria discodermiae TaxID=3064389 RepID=UPI002740CEC8|nr:MOSC domain-containing protein [Ruegeria sp. 2205SS24-7]MDP5220602.1 MOSC domain-containing protein [Ruegeria sp. 2205SS24-7]
MKKTLLPPTGRSHENQTFSICIAEILNAELRDIPAASNGIGLEKIGYWLAAQNLALIPVRAPESFQWAGCWIGRLEGGDGYVVMAGTPSGVAWIPDGVISGSGDVCEGWVIAPPALALPQRDEKHGTIEAIFRFADSGAPGELLSSAHLLAGVGVDGDRYAIGKGHFQSEGRWGQALTLIEAEAIEYLASEHGVEMPAVDARRNIVTRGIDLNALLGQRFRVGEILCQGSRLAEPCAWLQKTTPPGMLRGLVHRGGLRADILEDGEIRLGDKIIPETNN